MKLCLVLQLFCCTFDSPSKLDSCKSYYYVYIDKKGNIEKLSLLF